MERCQSAGTQKIRVTWISSCITTSVESTTSALGRRLSACDDTEVGGCCVGQFDAGLKMLPLELDLRPTDRGSVG